MALLMMRAGVGGGDFFGEMVSATVACENEANVMARWAWWYG